MVSKNQKLTQIKAYNIVMRTYKQDYATNMDWLMDEIQTSKRKNLIEVAKCIVIQNQGSLKKNIHDQSA